MRAFIAVTGLIAAVAMSPNQVAAESRSCPPNPLTQAHEPWMKMSTGAVDRGGPAPASEANPLMLAAVRTVGNATGDSAETLIPVNPLTNRP